MFDSHCLCYYLAPYSITFALGDVSRSHLLTLSSPMLLEVSFTKVVATSSNVAVKQAITF